MSEYKVFLATPKGALDTEVESAYATVQVKFQQSVPDGVAVSVTRAVDDWTSNFKRCGSWDAWAHDVAAGVDYEFRTPRYNAVVCTTETVGKATAQIVEHALEAEKMVAVQTNGTVQRVYGVEAIDPENWKAGWHLTTTP
jgi:hypothetical protein